MRDTLRTSYDITCIDLGRTLVVTAKTSQAFSDVLVGEVWWCSGQSNMEITMWVARGWRTGTAGTAISTGLWRRR